MGSRDHHRGLTMPLTILRSVTIFATLVLVTLSVSGCDNAPPPQTDTPSAANAPVVLRRSLGGEPGSLDPRKLNLAIEFSIISDLFMGLSHLGPDGTPRPGSATHWTPNATRDVWTFYLRPQTWSDGMPITADDFVYSIRRAVTPATAAQFVDMLYSIKNAEAIVSGEMDPEALGVRALDPLTLEITLEHPVAGLPILLYGASNLYMAPVPRHVIEAHGDAWARPEHMVVNGAYKPVDWVPNAYIRLERNPLYVDADQVAIDEVIYVTAEDPGTALRRFRAGDIDILQQVPPALVRTWRDRLGEQFHSTDGHITNYLSFNTERAPFTDPRLRRAVALALDLKTITGELRPLDEVPATSFTPAATPYGAHRPKVMHADRPRAERLAEARALLTEMGISPETPLEAELRFYTGSGGWRQVAIAIQATLEELGISLSLLGNDLKTHFDAVEAGNFDLSIDGFIGDGDTPLSLLMFFHSDSPATAHGGYRDATFDRLLDAAEREPDLDTHYRLLGEAEQRLLDSYAIVPLIHPRVVSAVAPHVDGFVPNPRLNALSEYLRIKAPEAP